ncbi:MAG TPA: MotA/TolQ/ExbB proton channel family protein [Thermoanaerobaculia bacterium]|nr:MotA/TolQ/ExbB proton channel family protein [Thermoanaerobaculia bacterium]
MRSVVDFSKLGLDQVSAIGLAVIGILCLLSVWSVAVSAERLIVFVRARRQSLAFARKLSQSRRDDWLDDAIEAAGQFPHSHLARVVSAGLTTFQKKRAKGVLPPAAVFEATERALDLSSLRTTAELRRGIGSLGTIASISPFVGLFGTVVGIIHAFDKLGQQTGGVGGFAVVSQGDRRGPGHHRPGARGGHPRGLDVQLPLAVDRAPRHGDG